MEEETGIAPRLVEIVTETPGWLTSDLPEDLVGKLWKGRSRGQRQKWYLARFLGADSDVNLATSHPEFRAWKWASAQELPQMTVPFKRRLYAALNRKGVVQGTRLAVGVDVGRGGIIKKNR